MTRDHVLAHLTEAADALTRLRQDEETLDRVVQAVTLMAGALRAGGKILSCGNGGSLCDAMHFAEELSGRYRDDRPALAALCLSDPGHITCVGNDYGFEHVFARGVEALGRPGDVLVGFSTSGRSPNVVAAARAAREAGMSVIALTGRSGSELEKAADLALITPGGRYADRVQELHIKLVHVMIDGIERALGHAPLGEG
jgi:D-sedoheptulose 7-phosphate isomerase